MNAFFRFIQRIEMFVSETCQSLQPHSNIGLVSSGTEVTEFQEKCRNLLFFIILCIVSGPAGSQVLHYNKYYEKEIHDTEVFVAQGSDHKNVEKSFLFSYFLAPKQKN